MIFLILSPRKYFEIVGSSTAVLNSKHKKLYTFLIKAGERDESLQLNKQFSALITLQLWKVSFNSIFSHHCAMTKSMFISTRGKDILFSLRLFGHTGNDACLPQFVLLTMKCQTKSRNKKIRRES